jgi:hypothetical protein
VRFNAETECEAGELVWIDVRRSQDIWMHHARPAQLNPTGRLTNATALPPQLKQL